MLPPVKRVVFYGLAGGVLLALLKLIAKLYANPLFNVAVTFMEVFPVGLIVTLVSAAILRRKPRPDAPASAVPT
jgi:hypothetical protein